MNFSSSASNRSNRTARDGIGAAQVLLLIMLIATVDRIWALSVQGILHSDEIWQYLEPAHGLVFGRWIIAWEYRSGLRSWFMPDILAGPMWIGAKLAPGTQAYSYLPQLVVATASLGVVVGAWLVGRAVSARHGLLAAFACAVWPDLVRFGSTSLSESLSVSAFVLAAGLLAQRRAEAKTIVGAGFLFAVSFSIRLQNAPAILAFVAVEVWQRRDWPTVRALLLGALIGLIPGAVADLTSGNVPLLWVFRNFDANLLQNKSAHYGVAPPTSYLLEFLYFWGPLTSPVLFLAAFGARRCPALSAAAIVHFAVHSAIPHKEYRFILLTVAVVVLCAGLGSADLIEKLSKTNARVSARFAAFCWALAAVGVEARGRLGSEWHGNDAMLAANRLAASQPGVCGLAVVGYEHILQVSYLTYHRDTPIFGFANPDSVERARAAENAFNVIIARNGVAQTINSAYIQQGCVSGSDVYCVSRRAGSCPIAGSQPTLNDELARVGE